MSEAIDWLNSEAISLWGAPVSWAEVVGAVTGLLAVWWTTRQHVWNWPMGILNSAIFMIVFLDVKLYASAFLQIVFIGLGSYGWWAWTHHDASRVERSIRRTSRVEWIAMSSIGIVVLAAWTTWLTTGTDSPAPLWDALTLTLSLLATYGQAQKLIESWWIWIAVDLISVPLYLSRHLYPTAALYVVFGLLCALGLHDWHRTLRGSAAPLPLLEVAAP